MPLTVGDVLGPYEILGPLGQGGMGEVYRARDTRLRREVAVKVLREEIANDPDSLSCFRRETHAVAALNHPNILAIHDAGEEGGLPYAVTELLDGETLADRLAAGPLPSRRAVEIAAQVADPRLRHRADRGDRFAPKYEGGQFAYRWPDVLAGGRALLFAVYTGGKDFDDALIALRRMDDGEPKIILRGGTNPRYSPEGYILFARAGAILAAPFDGSEVTGTPVTILRSVRLESTGVAQSALSGDTLVYVPGTGSPAHWEPVWVDRGGRAEALFEKPGDFYSPRFSPDGRQIVFSKGDANQEQRAEPRASALRRRAGRHAIRHAARHHGGLSAAASRSDRLDGARTAGEAGSLKRSVFRRTRPTYRAAANRRSGASRPAPWAPGSARRSTRLCRRRRAFAAGSARIRHRR